MFKFDWTPAAIAELRRLWDEGLPTGQIGYLIGCGKNAAIGKAHRLGLTPRPAAIKSEVTKPSKKARPKVTLQPLPSAVVVAPEPVKAVPRVQIPMNGPVRQPSVVLLPRPKQCTAVEKLGGRWVRCQGRVTGRSSWCDACAARFVVPPRVRAAGE